MLTVFDKNIYVMAASRTPIGRFNGRLAAFSAPELGGRAIEAALRGAGVQPAQVQMVTMGCVVTSGLGEAPAKQAALRAGIPDTVYSRTVESVCGSAMEALSSTIDVLLLGRVDVAVAGGMESRTNAPYLLEPRFIRSGSGYAKGERLRLKKSGAYRWQYAENPDQQLALSSIVDATAYDGLFWPVERKFMREYAVAYARKNQIALGDVNAQAALSHEKARTAWEQGYFEGEVVSLGDISQDDLVSAEALDKMREEAAADIACAYNTSTPADNGAVAVLATERFLDSCPGKPLARLLGISRLDSSAADFIDSPVRAVKMLLGEIDGKVCSESQFEIFELNEAFGIQLPVFMREFPGKIINVHGGAIALGHPFGSAGVRLLTTLAHAMKRLRIRYGAAGICFGSGGSYALAIEQLQAL
jgi:acetyl-CoA C-acetyltransferase